MIYIKYQMISKYAYISDKYINHYNEKYENSVKFWKFVVISEYRIKNHD